MSSHIRQISSDLRRFIPKSFWVQVSAIFVLGFVAILVVSL